MFVLQGVLLLKSDRTPVGLPGSQKLIRLWVHEVYRVFSDRLEDEADTQTFFTMVKVRDMAFGHYDVHYYYFFGLFPIWVRRIEFSINHSN